MWDQKTGKSMAIVDGTDAKSQFESSQQDSGFLSGPQNIFSSSELGDDIDITDRPTTVGNRPNIAPKSSNIVTSSSYTDSGAIEDFVDDDEDDNYHQLHNQSPSAKDSRDTTAAATTTKEQSSDTNMILDSGVDLGLEEWFCNLNLKNSTQPLNNLGLSCRKTLQDAQRFPKISKWQPALWEVCYIQDDDGDTQLHLTILGQYEQAAYTIIRLAPHASCLDIRNDDAQAPLHLAVLTRQPNIVRRLLVAGAKASIRDREGNTPLHLACQNSDIKCVEALTSPISIAESQEHQKYTERIQMLSPDLEQKNYNGEYCVHIAAQRNDIDILRLLVNRGADINAREAKCGYTPLHYASENSYEKLAKFLLSDCKKLNIETCTYGLLTAYQLAAERKNQKVMSQLEHCGAELLTPPQSDDDYSDSYDEDDEF